MKTYHARFTEGPVSRHVLSMASTSALGLFAVFLVDILTLMYVSMLGDQSLLAAVGLGKTLIFLNGAFSSGLVIGASALLSERIGRHASKALARLTSHMLIMALVLSGSIVLLELLFALPLARLLGGDLAVYHDARLYLWTVVPSSMLIAATQMCVQMLRAQGQVRLALGVLLAGAGTLVVADPLFIFGLDMGLEGAGISSLLAAGTSLILGLILVKRHIGLSPLINLRLLGLHARRTLRVALPAMLGNLAMPVGITYLMVVMAGVGTSALAGMAVIDRILQFGYCVFFALPGALVPVIAQNLGAGRDDRVKAIVVFTRRCVVLYGVTLWFCLALAGPWIADYFHLIDSGRALLLAFCQIGAGLWIVFGLDFVAQSMFLTMNRAWWVPVFGWIRGTLGTLPFVYVGANGFGGSGAVIGMWTGNTLVAIAAIVTASVVARRFFARRAQA
ncbi:MATE family efflux transporter [Pseudomonas atacamensis]|uniref:MATE family efflux transporter n=1 Tax=Pseudomonas atacamensis TaxID=2565368 RepID=UPI0024803098|nr:MATE family efflux transporter [Pseudomonas atacamensis]WGT36170.1 MATE family efflux transporter [Pseudomonas atacamensis]